MQLSFRKLRFAPALAIASAGVVLGATMPASAAVTPVSPEPGPAPVTAQPATLGALPSSQWQTNNSVWALAVRNGRLFAGGEFTSVRPPGAALGTGEVAASHIAAFNAATGEYDATFKHAINGKVQALAISPDGNTLYAGGVFTIVDGKTHNRVAAFDLTQAGAPLLPWAPSVTNGEVRGIAVSADNTQVVLGGSFTAVNGSTRNYVAKVAASDGTLSSWNPSIDGAVDTALVTPNGGQVIVGGNFEYANNVHHRALASLDLTTGANGTLDDMIYSCGKGCGTRSDVKALTTDGTLIYVGAEGTGGGWFDGTLAFDPTTGHQVWKNTCLGATQAVAIVGGVLYDGSHAHDCSSMGAFGQAPFQSGPTSWNHLMGLRADNGGVLDWFPTTNPGAFVNGQLPANVLGPRAMASDGTNLYVGGQFTTVNNAGQQGITRFMASSTHSAPRAVTGGSASLLPNGGAVLTFPTSTDPDSGALTYNVYRDGKFTAPVATYGPMWSHWWKSSLITFRDSGLTAGTHYYNVEAVDETGLVTRSGQIKATTTGNGYANAVMAASPSLYWRLGETGNYATDSSGHGDTGLYNGGLNQNVAGAVPSDRAIHLSSTGNVFSTSRATTVPATYSVETWIRTTTTTGGRILGFGNSQTGTSSSYDRMLYMNNNGQLIFGVYATVAPAKSPSTQYVWSPKGYNDGTWHHVLVTQGSNGLILYVDGIQVSAKAAVTTAQNYAGYWRIGADNLNNWPQRPTSNGFTGDVDEVAIYSTVLNATTAKAHMTAE